MEGGFILSWNMGMCQHGRDGRETGITFGADGSVTWEEKRSGDVEIRRGQWLASSDSLGIEFDNQTLFVDYEVFQGGLEIRYDNKNFKLLPR